MGLTLSIPSNPVHPVMAAGPSGGRCPRCGCHTGGRLQQGMAWAAAAGPLSFSFFCAKLLADGLIRQWPSAVPVRSMAASFWFDLLGTMRQSPILLFPQPQVSRQTVVKSRVHATRSESLGPLARLCPASTEAMIGQIIQHAHKGSPQQALDTLISIGRRIGGTGPKLHTAGREGTGRPWHPDLRFAAPGQSAYASGPSSVDITTG